MLQFPADAALAHLHRNNYCIADSLHKLAEPGGAAPVDTQSLYEWSDEEVCPDQ